MSYDAADLGGTNSLVGYLPSNYSLLNIYPNPFNSKLSIEIEALKNGFVELDIYNLSGKKVKEIFKDDLVKGIYSFNVDFEGLHSGQYFVRMKRDGILETKKVLLVK
jgi:hypothetical protein